MSPACTAAALWVSEDGIRFRTEWTQLGFDLIPRYYPSYHPDHVKKVKGTNPKFEHPKVLCVDGRPAWFYALAVERYGRAAASQPRAEDPFAGRGWSTERAPVCSRGHAMKLDAPPVFDGMIAADGRLLLCDRKGRLRSVQTRN